MSDLFFNDFDNHFGVLKVESEQSSCNSFPTQHQTFVPEIYPVSKIQIALLSVQLSAMLQPGDAPPPNPH